MDENRNQEQWQEAGYGPYDPNARYAGGPYDPNTGRYLGGYTAGSPGGAGGTAPGGGPDFPVAKKPVVPWVVAVVGLALAAIMTFFWFRGTKKIGDLTEQNTALAGQVKELTQQSATDGQDKASLENRLEQLTDQVDSLSREKEELKEQISSLESGNSDLETENAALEADAGLLSTICSFLRSGTAGYASDSYYAKEKILVLNPGEETSLDIVADIKDVTISVSRVGSAADANWATDGFDTVAELTVTALETGVTTLKFTNDVNDQAFQVLVVVVD